MAGGVVKYRHLSRGSAHRQALLRNLVTSLVKHESIRTTWAKAKETQRMADKLITLAKRNNETSRRKAHGILYTPDDLMPKLFTTLRQRYEARPGGYTRVLRTEPKSTYDQAPSAILEFVDGPKDMRFHMTAARVAKDHLLGQRPNKLTLLNRKKVTQFRGATGSAGKKPTGKQEFNDMVERMKGLKVVSSGVDMLSVAATRSKSGKPVVVVEDEKSSPEKTA
ncbi:ribosomal protein YmL8 [Apiospora arundinis]|uniref:Ribosomal protein L17 n=1 Tax=Apiospora arundinis TaxID=335852 RepID=A0ABR2JJ77_9PEZI